MADAPGDAVSRDSAARGRDGTPPESTALITGATGFVASRLTRRLVERGWRVHAVIRPSARLDQLSPVLPRVTLHHHDGSMDGMLRVVETARPDVVFHLASLFLAQHKTPDVVPLINSNVAFGSQLLEAMAVHGCHRLVNTGTAWQHYADQEYSPVCLYAATKQAFEAIIQYYVEAGALRAITLKLCDTYGPGDPRPKLLAVLKNAAATGQTMQMSPGDQRLDLVYIDDVCDAFEIAARRLLDGRVTGHETYAVRSGASCTLKELFRLVETILGHAIPAEWGARPYRPREVMQPWSGGAALPGFSARVPLAEGLRRTLLDAP